MRHFLGKEAKTVSFTPQQLRALIKSVNQDRGFRQPAGYEPVTLRPYKPMQSVVVPLEIDLVAKIDRAAKRAGLSRATWIEDILQRKLERNNPWLSDPPIDASAEAR
jgi:hypothetical protein